MMTVGGANDRLHIVSLFMQRTYGSWAARIVTGLVMWTAFTSVFSLMLGYSRVPYAAALDGNYFRIFAKVHPEHRFPVCVAGEPGSGGRDISVFFASPTSSPHWW